MAKKAGSVAAVFTAAGLTTAAFFKAAGLTVLLFWGACVCLFPGSAAAAQTPPLVLKLNHQFPADTPGSKIDQWFADQIEKRTKGRVSIRIFWSDGLGEPGENLSLLKRGRIDMAAMSPGYFPDAMPLLAAPNAIPMAMDNVCQAGEIMDRFLDQVPGVMEEALSNGVRPLVFHLLNPYLLVTKAPVERLADLAGKRIRTWGDQIPELIRAAGAKPVPLFLTDIRPAMEKGVIDGCPFSVDLVVSYKIYELARHITEVVVWEGPGWALWIGEKAWTRLSGDQRRIFLDTAQEARERELNLTLAAERRARNFLVRQGVVFHPFPPGDLKAWQSAAPDFFQEFIRKSRGFGKEDAAREMVAIWQELQKRKKCP